MAAALVAVQGFLIVQLVSSRSLKSKLQHMKQQLLDQAESLRQVQALQNQLDAAQQATTAAQQATTAAQEEAAQARAAERQAVADATAAQQAITAAQQDAAKAKAAEKQTRASAKAAACLATRWLEAVRRIVTRPTFPSSPELQPPEHLSCGLQPMLKAIHTCDVRTLAEQLTSTQVLATNRNIAGVDSIANTTVSATDESLQSLMLKPQQCASAKEHSIAAALILLSHMTPQQALDVVNLLSGDMVAGGFAAACDRMVQQQAQCDAVLVPICESTQIHNILWLWSFTTKHPHWVLTCADGSLVEISKNTTFLIVSLLLQNITVDQCLLPMRPEPVLAVPPRGADSESLEMMQSYELHDH